MLGCVTAPVAASDFIPLLDYKAANDSPFPQFGIDGLLEIEDFEDGEINTPGVIFSSLGNVVEIQEGFGIASEPDGGKTGKALESFHTVCATTYPAQCPATVVLDFTTEAFGMLPTYAGFVWTDAVRESESDIHPWARVTVTDAEGNQDSTLFNELPLRSELASAAADDTFISFVNEAGISNLQITIVTNGGNGGHLAIDHLQYGVASLAGDSDRDGDVDFADFTTFAMNFGNRQAAWQDGDFDFDGSSNFSDFVRLADNFGKELPSFVLKKDAGVGAVPEPASIQMLLLAALGLLGFARRK